MTHNEKKSLYESIMMDVAKIVKRQINENNASKRFDDMFNSKDGYEDLKTSYMNVYDMAKRRNFDKEWAKNIMPISRFSPEELLKRYVCALMIFNCRKKPTCLRDVMDIGIFKNYMIEYLDKTKSYDVFDNLNLPEKKLLEN